MTSSGSLVKKVFRKNAPSTYKALQGVRDQLNIELKTFRNIGFRSIFWSLVSKENWEDVLPVQLPLAQTSSSLRFRTFDELEAQLTYKNEGAHTIYLSPDEWSASPLEFLMSKYPAGCGLKLCKRLGSVKAPYMQEKNGVVLERLLVDHNRQVLVMNFLRQLGLGPRLVDLIELQGGGTDPCVAYVVEHAGEGQPSMDDCNAFLDLLKEKLETTPLEIYNAEGFDNLDFYGPDCNGNLIKLRDGRCVYVDTQNFALKDYDQYLTNVAQSVQGASHFGDRSHLLGGKYLYQAIPGVSLPAKRDPADRMPIFQRMLSKVGIEIENRVILDVGCNLGLIGAHFLKNGAHWYHGWDLEEVVESSDQVLSSIGCTRYSLTGGVLSERTDLRAGLPLHLNNSMNGILTYLSIRGHVGWLPALKTLSWEYMIYEGHEGESEEVSRAHLAELSEMVACSIVQESEITDGTSDSRYIALVRRA